MFLLCLYPESAVDPSLPILIPIFSMINTTFRSIAPPMLISIIKAHPVAIVPKARHFQHERQITRHHDGFSILRHCLVDLPYEILHRPLAIVDAYVDFVIPGRILPWRGLVSLVLHHVHPACARCESRTNVPHEWWRNAGAVLLAVGTDAFLLVVADVELGALYASVNTMVVAAVEAVGAVLWARVARWRRFQCVCWIAVAADIVGAEIHV